MPTSSTVEYILRRVKSIISTIYIKTSCCMGRNVVTNIMLSPLFAKITPICQVVPWTPPFPPIQSCLAVFACSMESVFEKNAHFCPWPRRHVLNFGHGGEGGKPWVPCWVPCDGRLFRKQRKQFSWHFISQIREPIFFDSVYFEGVVEAGGLAKGKRSMGGRGGGHPCVRGVLGTRE